MDHPLRLPGVGAESDSRPDLYAFVPVIIERALVWTSVSGPGGWLLFSRGVARGPTKGERGEMDPLEWPLTSVLAPRSTMSEGGGQMRGATSGCLVAGREKHQETPSGVCLGAESSVHREKKMGAPKRERDTPMGC